MIPTGCAVTENSKCKVYFALAVSCVSARLSGGLFFNAHITNKKKNMKKRALYHFFILCLIGVWGCATQSDLNTIDNRLTDMELRDAQLSRGKEELKSDIEVRNQELRKQSAGLRAMLEQMDEEVRILSGRLEELEHSIKQQQSAAQESEIKRQEKLDRLAQLTDQNSDKILRMEQYLNLESSKKPVAAAIPGIPAGKPLTEEEAYQSAKQAFDRGDFEAARTGFEEFVKRHPNSKDADNAQFWIGEIYYSEKWYEKAILEYQNVIEKYPTGNKVPAALLKQGLAFASIGDKPNAKLILEELRRKYPDSNEAKIAAEQLKTLK